MDLRSGKLILESSVDVDKLNGKSFRSFSVMRENDLKRRVPEFLTASETLMVIDKLTEVATKGTERSSVEEKLESKGAIETLQIIAHLGITASAREGANVELVNNIVDALKPEQVDEQTA